MRPRRRGLATRRADATRQHWIHAAAYDTMTGPLERAVLAERRACLLAPLDGQVLEVGAGDIAAAVRRAGFTIETAESFDSYLQWMLARPLLEAVAAAARER